MCMDDPADETLPAKDTSGLYNSDEAFDLGDTQPTTGTRPPKPAAPEDPDWGKTTYAPKISSVARRAALFDLPNPSEATVDPFATDPDVTRAVTPQSPPDNMHVSMQIIARTTCRGRRRVNVWPTLVVISPLPSLKIAARARYVAPGGSARSRRARRCLLSRHV